MKYLLVVLTVLSVISSLAALDLDFFGMAEGRFRYEMDTQKNNTDSDADRTLKESKYNDLSFLYGGFVGVNAKFRNALRANLTIGLDGTSNMVKAPDDMTIIVDEAAVYYDDDKWIFGMGKYHEEEHAVNILHYNVTQPVDKWWAENRNYMMGITPGFRVNKNIMFRILTDAVYNTHGFTSKTKEGTETENPSKDQWVIGGSIPMKFMDKDAFTFEPMVLYSLEAITTASDSVGTTYERIPSRITFGATIGYNITEKVNFSIGGGMSSCSIDKESDADLHINASYYKDSAMNILGGLTFKDLGPGSLVLMGHYGSWKNTVRDNNDNETDVTFNTMFFRVEYPLILGRLDIDNEAKRAKTQIYLKPRVKVWMTSWDPDDRVTLDQETKIRFEMILGGKF